jgi:hypothetical protein
VPPASTPVRRNSSIWSESWIAAAAFAACQGYDGSSRQDFTTSGEESGDTAMGCNWGGLEGRYDACREEDGDLHGWVLWRTAYYTKKYFLPPARKFGGNRQLLTSHSPQSAMNMRPEESVAKQTEEGSQPIYWSVLHHKNVNAHDESSSLDVGIPRVIREQEPLVKEGNSKSVEYGSVDKKNKEGEKTRHRRKWSKVRELVETDELVSTILLFIARAAFHHGS